MADEDVMNRKRQHLITLDREEVVATENDTTEKLRELMDRANMLIDQVNNLYNQYVVGVIDTPPIERRGQLDQIINTVTLMGKPTRSLRFKFMNLQGKYTTYRDRWEKRLKDLEAGKIQRVTGPGKATDARKRRAREAA